MMVLSHPQFQALLGRFYDAEVPLYRKVLEQRQNLYNEALAVKAYTPFLIPWDLFPVFCLTIGVTFSPRLRHPFSKALRTLLFVLQLLYFVTRWSQARTLGMACGYGIGLASQWGAIMSFVLLIMHDPGQDFKRLEIRPVGIGKEGVTEANGESHERFHRNVDLRTRRVYGIHSTLKKPLPLSEDEAIGKSYRYIWQGHPQELWHVVDWSFDLMTAFRGLNWNFRAKSFPLADIPLPQLDKPSTDSMSCPDQSTIPTAIPRSTFRQLRGRAIRDFTFYYIYIDLLKTCLMTDPFFLGITSLNSPATWLWLARLNRSIPFATKLVRLCISLMSVAAALSFIFSLAPLFFAIVVPSMLGDKWYTITKSPLQEPWMYPPQWGPMFKSLRTKGLAGMWGVWWHQMFRYGMSEPSGLILQHLNIDGKTQTGRCIKLFVAFGLSGAIHAAGSSTTFSIIPSRPLMPLLFFLCQGLGIAIQAELSRLLKRWVHPREVTRQIGNLAFVLVWLWFTGPLLANDFARCGIWLFEPVPVSLFRGMGYGPADTCFPWLNPPKGGRWIGWWTGDSWYRTGIAIF